MQWKIIFVIFALFIVEYDQRHFKQGTKHSKHGKKHTKLGTQHYGGPPPQPQPVSISNYPFMVAVITLTNNVLKWECSGAILGRYAVLTTASCVINFPDDLLMKKYFRVRSNTSILEDGFEIFVDHFIGHVYVHPNYGGTLNSYDSNIGLAMVTSEFNGKWEKPIALPRKSLKFQDFDQAMVYTWHNTLLFGTNVTMAVFKECKNIYEWNGQFVSNRVACGKVYGNTDFCLEMEAGVLILENQLLGIGSFSFECAAYHIPAVFTRVDKHLEWLYSYLPKL